MWTEADEEMYLDLDIIQAWLLPKRTVKGDLKQDTYIQEKKVAFELMPFFEKAISMYLPEGKVAEHYGKDFFYFGEMGEYVEYVSADESMIFTVEKCRNRNFNAEGDWENEEAMYQCLIDDIEENNEGTLSCYWKDFETTESKQKVYVLRAMAEIEEENCEGLIYCVQDANVSYRFYVASYRNEIELVNVLGEKIIENMVWHNMA